MTTNEQSCFNVICKSSCSPRPVRLLRRAVPKPNQPRPSSRSRWSHTSQTITRRRYQRCSPRDSMLNHAPNLRCDSAQFQVQKLSSRGGSTFSARGSLEVTRYDKQRRSSLESWASQHSASFPSSTTLQCQQPSWLQIRDSQCRCPPTHFF